MASLGDKLRKARESQGRELSQIAEETRIHSRYLAAIEAEDWDTLPGGFFRKSFVHQYAQNLGVAEIDIEPELDQLAARDAPPLIPGQEPRRVGSKLPPIAVASHSPRHSFKSLGAVMALLAVLAVCAVVYSLWLNQQQQQPGQPQQVVTGREAVPDPPPQRANEPVAEPAPEPPASTASGQNPLASEVGRPTQVQAEGPLWIMIEAKEATWVRITSGGQHLFSGVLEPNETKKLYGLENAKVLVGNAGGLEIQSNGRPIGPIGLRGQVRVIILTPEGAEISTPKLKPAAGGPVVDNSAGA